MPEPQPSATILVHRGLNSESPHARTAEQAFPAIVPEWTCCWIRPSLTACPRARAGSTSAGSAESTIGQPGRSRSDSSTSGSPETFPTRSCSSSIPPVLTLGRQADEGHVRATPAELAARGIELIRVERGGEVTYHGPGQLVAYPIVALARRGLLLRPFVRALEGAMVDTCRALGVAGRIAVTATPAAGSTSRAHDRARSARSACASSAASATTGSP